MHQLSNRKLAIVVVIHVIVIAITASFRGCAPKPNHEAIDLVPLGTDNPALGKPVEDSLAGEQASKGPEKAPAPEPPQPKPEPPQPPAPPTPPAPPVKIPEPTPEPEPPKIESREPVVLPEDTPKPPKKTPPKKDEKKKPAQPPKDEPEKISTQKVPPKETKKAAPSINVSLNKVTRTAATSTTRDTTPGPSGGGGKGTDSNRGINKGDTIGKVGEISAGTLKDSLKRSLETPGAHDGSTSGVGMRGSPNGSSSDYTRYIALIKDTIERRWKKPDLPDIAQLETTVEIRIAPDGSLTFLGVRKSSGNPEMDESVTSAIRSVSRIPERLPEGLGTPNYDTKINFRLR